MTDTTREIGATTSPKEADLPTDPHHGGAAKIYMRIPATGKSFEELPPIHRAFSDLFNYAYGLETLLESERQENKRMAGELESAKVMEVLRNMLAPHRVRIQELLREWVMTRTPNQLIALLENEIARPTPQPAEIKPEGGGT